MKKEIKSLLQRLQKQKKVVAPISGEATIYTSNKNIFVYSDLKFDEDGRFNGIEALPTIKPNNFILWEDAFAGLEKYISRLQTKSKAFQELYNYILKTDNINHSFIINDLIKNIVNDVPINTYYDKLANKLDNKKESYHCLSLIGGITLHDSLTQFKLNIKNHSVTIRRITIEDINYVYGEMPNYASHIESAAIEFVCSDSTLIDSIRGTVLQILTLYTNCYCTYYHSIIDSNLFATNKNYMSPLAYNTYPFNYKIVKNNKPSIILASKLLFNKLPSVKDYIIQPASTGKTSHINIALNRFTLAVRNEIRMLETLTYSVNMLEALLLTEKDEITLRFTNRVFVLYNSIKTVSDIEGFIRNIKKAYTLRSKYIHGDLHKKSDYIDFNYNQFLDISRIILLFYLLVQNEIKKSDFIELIDSSIFNKDDKLKLDLLVKSSRVKSII